MVMDVEADAFISIADIMQLYQLSERLTRWHLLRCLNMQPGSLGPLAIRAMSWARYFREVQRLGDDGAIELRRLLPEPVSYSGKEDCRSVVYFLQGGTQKLIKIGTSNNLAYRLDTIASCSPDPIEVLVTVPGDTGLERALHKKFAKYRCHHEWFYPEPELVELIDAIQKLMIAPRE